MLCQKAASTLTATLGQYGRQSYGSCSAWRKRETYRRKDPTDQRYSIRAQHDKLMSTEHRRLPIIYLFTKDDCTLCDEAKVVLRPYMHRFTLEEVDITLPENEDWYNLYKYDIPVFHMFEKILFKHRVDVQVLKSALNDYEHGR